MKKITRDLVRDENSILHRHDDRKRVIRPIIEDMLAVPHTLVKRRVLTDEECNMLVALMLQADFVELDPKSLDNHAIEPKDKSLLESPLSWKYSHPDGKDYMNLIPDSYQFEQAMEIVMDVLPEDVQYSTVNYAQIILYNTDTLFHWHKDIADENDSATVIFTLNDNFEGGVFNLDENTFKLGSGDMIAFNNPTERWHNVTPITEGERFCFAIWFGLQETNEDEEDEQSNSEVQSVSEGTSDS